MHYSLVSSPVLGFDLCRLPAGSAVADVLLRGLACTEGDLAILAAHHDAAGRARRWDAVRAAATAQPDVAQSLRRVESDLLGRGRSDGSELDADEGLVRVLRSSPLADADALVRLVHDDVLDWTWSPAVTEGGPRLRTTEAARAADVLADAAVSAYLADHLDDDLRRALAAPFVAALRELPEDFFASSPLDGPLEGMTCLLSTLGDLRADVRHVLDQLARLHGADRAALRAAAGTDRPCGTEWASAVHEASWAVHLTGRTRTAAAAQLLAVRAFRAGGLDATDGADGLWNIVSGVVHAEVVVDVLSYDARAILVRVWDSVFGRD
ncbi:hypothetical protein ACFFKU_02840 [Kineococcus gynurae]|uniref:Uncharacterized protein n=1 Tax=Kineococcus gynurae TaxID=452979 RepID=A0ABV5LS97_9ACTN